jgi:hypothetical protein
VADGGQARYRPRRYARRIPTSETRAIRAAFGFGWTDRWHSRVGYVYFVRDAATGYVKVGSSRRPWDRAKSLGRKAKEIGRRAPGAVTFLGAILTGNCRQLEKAMHFLLERHRVAGEWFELDDNAINQVVSICRSEVVPVNVLLTPTDCNPASRVRVPEVEDLIDRGFSVDDIAERMKVSYRTVYRWRSGRSKIPPKAKKRLNRLAAQKRPA